MRALSLAIAAWAIALPVFAEAPVPVFGSPTELLDAVYAQHQSEVYDPDSAFLETDTFSTRLAELYAEADEKMQAYGDEMGVLDFSPFINGQDPGGLTFEVAAPKLKGRRAITDVDILIEGSWLYAVTFQFVDEGAVGWKVDDILLPKGDDDETYALSEFFADALTQ